MELNVVPTRAFDLRAYLAREVFPRSTDARALDEALSPIVIALQALTDVHFSSPRPRVFGPKAEDHPSVGDICPGCRCPFAAGEYTMLVVIGPGADEEGRRDAREGRAYNAVAMEAHAGCVTGIEAP